VNFFQRQFEEMSNSSQAIAVSLKGSTDIVTEFFNFSVNTILYQRGIYPPESFKKIPKYGLSMMVTIDEGLSAYMANILRQLDGESL
jgi:mitotic spindle assembly checkpoint protein MAD2